MTHENQRVTIAKACGWHIKHSKHFKHLCRPKELNGACCGLHLSDREIFSLFLTLSEDFNAPYIIPDYTSDLNACYEIEEVLTKEQKYAYTQKLLSLPSIGFGGTEPMGFCFLVLHATASQRCEAFLKVLNLWETN